MANEFSRAPLAVNVADGTTFRLIGLGGVGGLLARPLAMFLSNLTVRTRLLLIDGDPFERGNRSRQWFKEEGNKAAVVCAELLEVAADSLTTIFAVPKFVDQENAGHLIPPAFGRQVVILALDNHAGRKLVSDHVEGLDLPEGAEIALFSGGNDPAQGDTSGTYGNVQIFVNKRDFGERARKSIPLTRYHPEIAEPGDRHPGELSCVEQMISAPQLLAANFAVASALFNAVYMHCCERLDYSELYLDVAEGLMRPAAYPAPHTLLKG